MTLDIN